MYQRNFDASNIIVFPMKENCLTVEAMYASSNCMPIRHTPLHIINYEQFYITPATPHSAVRCTEIISIVTLLCHNEFIFKLILHYHPRKRLRESNNGA